MNPNNPCYIDYTEKSQIIQHFRDLILLSRFLDYDVEMLKFIRILKEKTYTDEHVAKFIEIAGYNTFWEDQIDKLIIVGKRR